MPRPGLSSLGDKERAGLQEVIALPPELGVERGPLMPGLPSLADKERAGLQEVIAIPPEFGVEREVRSSPFPQSLV